MNDEIVTAVVERLRAAPKYCSIHQDTLIDIVRRESAHAGRARELERLARLKLHKVVASYLLSTRPDRVLRGMDDALAGGDAAVRDWCRTMLASHVSTAERLADLELLYPAIIELTGGMESIADLACALNPFTLPWLRAVTDATYTGYDINLSYVQLATQFLGWADANASVQHREILVRPAEIRADVALLLKTYHCIEDRQPGAALRLVEEVSADQVVVSFPVRTMSGRLATFTPAHIANLTSLAERRGWGLRRASLGCEEFVVLTKASADAARG
jgi:16S rRNA (guanine(1405)-N(7))-methyltransferase